eukprot:365228-Chlamydomonas_euryale.AAC.21
MHGSEGYVTTVPHLALKLATERADLAILLNLGLLELLPKHFVLREHAPWTIITRAAVSQVMSHGQFLQGRHAEDPTCIDAIPHCRPKGAET